MKWLWLLINVIVNRAGRRSQYGWRLVAAQQRAKQRRELRQIFIEARLTRMSHALERLIITSNVPMTHQAAGYVHIEIPPLVQWLVEQNHGARELLNFAVTNMAQSQLQEVLTG